VVRSTVERPSLMRHALREVTSEGRLRALAEVEEAVSVTVRLTWQTASRSGQSS